ncbi:hypothetical protein VNI00_016953 [Paramarasmius palmivorus]|uniref:Uncharacterized protein n=1 Tax=Paramarasmius palmivorus TaxID=297713 RepID=A0AAW0B9B7_9AGAR
MRQREKAKEIREKFKQYGWGMTHGFFVIMGGFALYDGDVFCGYLWDDSRGDREEGLERWISQIGDQHEYVQKGPTQNPQPPPVHDANDTIKNTKVLPIQDKSLLINTPSDASCLLEFLLAKGYITITEDQIKDRSHADFVSKSIAVIQTTWFIFQVIARAVEGLAITEIEIITVGFALLNLGTYFLWWNKPLRVGYPVRVYWRHTERYTIESQEETIWSICRNGFLAVIDYIYATNFSDRIPDTIFFRLLLFPVLVPWHTFLTCWTLLEDEDGDLNHMAIPISSRLHKDPLHIYIIVYGIAALFGAVHCIPWLFYFPTHTEQLLWRISAVAIACSPITMGVLHGYLSSDMPSVPYWIFVTVPVLLSLAYVVFRVILIVIALMALRDLPSSAYQDVQWTMFIPHIG